MSGAGAVEQAGERVHPSTVAEVSWVYSGTGPAESPVRATRIGHPDGRGSCCCQWLLMPRWTT